MVKQKITIEEKIKNILEKVRPTLQADGGDIKFKNFKNGVLRVELMGMCAHCPMASITLKQGVETIIKKKIPEVKEVKAD